MITVLMATYNGQRFLAEQLDSLLAQTRLPDRIVIQDDQSTDATPAILDRYQRAHPGLIERRLNPVNSGGSAANFMSAMTGLRDDYLMLCDQDDVWLPDKIASSYALIRQMEQRWGTACPCLMHTDLQVVGEDLRPISASFKADTFANYDRTTLRDQIIQNTATGCTVMYNRALAELITEVPRDMVMHDWWISLIAAAFGQIDHLDTAPILYRQHGANQIGVTDMRTWRYRLNRLFHPQGLKADIAKTYPQAGEFRRVFAQRLTADQDRLLADYTAIPGRPKLARIASVVRLGVWKTGFARNVAYLMFV
jgi:glycosyltransferase involved in cell wall biosynthesis